jgi:hypothetical protein
MITARAKCAAAEATVSLYGMGTLYSLSSRAQQRRRYARDDTGFPAYAKAVCRSFSIVFTG